MKAPSALAEVCLVTAVAAALIRLQGAGPPAVAQLAPAVWIYLPLAVLALRGLNLAEHGFALQAWHAWWTLLAVAAIALALGVSPMTVLYHVAAIAIPEELFFRGYVQTRAERWRDGVAVPILISALLFAAAHVAIQPRWMRAAVFFPGLVMGWLRHRTRGLAIPAAFHASANLFMHVLSQQL